MNHPAPRRAAPGFTLIEVLVCLGIFALGFAAIAMMLPTGAVMQRDILARAMGDIIGKNSLEVVKGKGFYSLCDDYYPPGASYMTTGLPMSHRDEKYMFFLDANWDIPGGYPWTVDGSQAAAMGPYLNADTSGSYIRWTGNGFRVANWANATNYAYGVVHAFTNRSQGFSNLDFSYPSSVLDVTARSYFSNLLLTNLSIVPNTTCTWSLWVCKPDSDQWRVTAVTLMKPSAGEWLEQCESDGTNPDGQGAPADGWWRFNGSSNPGMLTSSTPVDMRSIGGDPSVAGLPDPSGLLWRRYYQGTASMGTVPKTGGDPGNANPWFRGAPTQHVASWINAYGGSYGPAWNSGICKYLTLPVREDAAGGANSQYKYTDPASGKVVGWTAPNYYRYSVPGIMQVYATVYDRDNDLMLLRYPLCFAKQLKDAPNLGGWKETANSRVANFQKAIGVDPATGAGWVDRKLQVNDKFMINRGAYALTVKEILDPAGEAAKVNAALGDQVDWSDGTYQVVRVSPPLRSAALTANKPNAYRTLSSWSDPDPISAFVVPPPISGGPSPWISTLQQDDGGAVSKRNGVFSRPWNCLTN